MSEYKRLFRDSDDKRVGGVCSGLAIYFGLDVTLLRVIFLAAFILGCGSGFWIYVIFWIAAPETKTAEDKCALRGLPPTPENLYRFTKF